MFHFQDEVYDRRLGRHLVSLYYRSADQAADELLDMTILRDYLVSKSKAKCHVSWSLKLVLTSLVNFALKVTLCCPSVVFQVKLICLKL